MLPIDLLEYEDERGRSPFGEWRAGLDPQTRARVSKSVMRLAFGNVSNVKGVGGGVSELKVDFGPGYRVYFGRDGAQIVILLGGGTKKRQQRDIEAAMERWSAYRIRKRE